MEVILMSNINDFIGGGGDVPYLGLSKAATNFTTSVEGAIPALKGDKSCFSIEKTGALTRYNDAGAVDWTVSTTGDAKCDEWTGFFYDDVNDLLHMIASDDNYYVLYIRYDAITGARIKPAATDTSLGSAHKSSLCKNLISMSGDTITVLDRYYLDGYTINTVTGLLTPFTDIPDTGNSVLLRYIQGIELSAYFGDPNMVFLSADGAGTNHNYKCRYASALSEIDPSTILYQVSNFVNWTKDYMRVNDYISTSSEGTLLSDLYSSDELILSLNKLLSSAGILKTIMVA